MTLGGAGTVFAFSDESRNQIWILLFSLEETEDSETKTCAFLQDQNFPSSEFLGGFDFIHFHFQMVFAKPNLK